jgi:hypothetical protein
MLVMASILALGVSQAPVLELGCLKSDFGIEWGSSVEVVRAGLARKFPEGAMRLEPLVRDDPSAEQRYEVRGSGQPELGIPPAASTVLLFKGNALAGLELRFRPDVSRRASTWTRDRLSARYGKPTKPTTVGSSRDYVPPVEVTVWECGDSQIALLASEWTGPLALGYQPRLVL